MRPPVNAGELLQFTSAMQWLRNSIPQFSAIIQPILDSLERVYAHVGKRTKRSIQRIPLTLIGWGKKEMESFEACRSALRERVTLCHRDETKRLCFYVDASDTHWAGVVTQIPFSHVHQSHAEKQHDPLAFLSGHFTPTQLRWSTIEKEAFSVMATIERMHWLASSPAGFDLFTDHNNLIFIFDPLSLSPDLSQTSIRKVVRWAVRLCAYNYTCIHISGADNVWADLLSRWHIGFKIRRLITIPALPSASDAEFKWPSNEEIARVQSDSTRPLHLRLEDGLWRTKDNRIWIPSDADNLQLRLCVISHTSAAGHRGRASTLRTLSSLFYWDSIVEDVGLFVKACIHCLSTTGGDRVPRPFAPAVHGTKPNDLVQFDYIHMAQCATGDKYILMIRDDHSGYTWFYPSPTTSAEQASHALIDWCAAFGAPVSFMSDGPTHFRNESIRLLAKGLRTRHHFTMAYCPWSNGAIERLGKELLRVSRSVLSELQLSPDVWPDLLPVFQSVINNSLSPQRNNIAPITAFTGQQPSPPILTFLRSETATPITISIAQREKTLNVDSLVSFMDKLHPLIQSSLSENRRRIRDASSNGKLPNFIEGDFVLVARDEFFEDEKLCLRWRGPRRIVKCLNDHVFKVEDLRNGAVSDVHASRLKYYSDESVDQKAVLSHVLSSETGMVVGRLLRLVKTDNGLFISVRWKGLSSSEDTLEPIAQIYADVPQLLIKLLERQSTPVDLARQARDLLQL